MLPNSLTRLNRPRTSPLLEGIFDRAVVTAELWGPGDAALLHPAEAALTTGFVRKRLGEFSGGRLCARYALRAVGVAAPVLMATDRSPQWPPSVVGSISHTSDYCCAVVAPASTFAAIGVDAEIVGRVSADLDSLVFTSAERALLAGLTARERSRASTVIFSAKEAFYKCQYPLTQRWLDFQDVSVHIVTTDMATGRFTVARAAGHEPLPMTIPLPLTGHFAIAEELVVTGLTLGR